MKGIASVMCVVASIAPGTGLAQGQDLSAGEKTFRKCSPCHSVGEDAKNKVEPVLNGLNGRKARTVDGFNYTDAKQELRHHVG
jgi:cytochrome c